MHWAIKGDATHFGEQSQVQALMKHVFQRMQRDKPTHRHKLLLELHSQAPTSLRLALNKVSKTVAMQGFCRIYVIQSSSAFERCLNKGMPTQTARICIWHLLQRKHLVHMLPWERTIELDDENVEQASDIYCIQMQFLCGLYIKHQTLSLCGGRTEPSQLITSNKLKFLLLRKRLPCHAQATKVLS